MPFKKQACNSILRSIATSRWWMVFAGEGDLALTPTARKAFSGGTSQLALLNGESGNPGQCPQYKNNVKAMHIFTI